MLHIRFRRWSDSKTCPSLPIHQQDGGQRSRVGLLYHSVVCVCVSGSGSAGGQWPFSYSVRTNITFLLILKTTLNTKLWTEPTAILSMLLPLWTHMHAHTHWPSIKLPTKGHLLETETEKKNADIEDGGGKNWGTAVRKWERRSSSIFPVRLFRLTHSGSQASVWSSGTSVFL